MGALGSCTGGSIRFPASLCGTVGIKPTYGRVSRAGVVTLSWSQDHVGPLTRRVEDAALMLQPIAGHDPRDPTSLRETPPNFVSAVDNEIDGLRIAWSPDFGFAEVDAEVLAVTTRAAYVFEELGCHVEGSDLVLEPPYDVFGPV